MILCLGEKIKFLEGKSMKKELLTNTEYKILKLFSKGFNRKEIAEKLNISYSQCRKMINEILAKMNTTNITTCLIKAYNEGIIEGK